MPRAASSKAAVSVIVEHDAWREVIDEPVPLLRRAATAAVSEVRRSRRSRAAWTPVVAVALMDDRAMRKLNHTYRGKDKPTNVLSFPSDEASDRASGAKRRRLGDVAMALGTIKREAKAQGKTVPDHVTHLMVHAVLHLLGYDHEADPDAEEMEAIERKTLAALGIADPYGDAK
jgi:probable rRNA maturation factor